MKMTQKLFAVLMAACMLLSFAACNSTQKEPVPDGSSSPESDESSTVVPEKTFVTDTMGSLSFTYADGLNVSGDDTIKRINYNDVAFFMVSSMPVDVDAGEEFNDVMAEMVITELGDMFNEDTWENGKMVTPISHETMNGIEIWSSDFECEMSGVAIKFNANITVAYYGNQAVVFILTSHNISYPEVSPQFADTIKSLQPAA